MKILTFVSLLSLSSWSFAAGRFSEDAIKDIKEYRDSIIKGLDQETGWIDDKEECLGWIESYEKVKKSTASVAAALGDTKGARDIEALDNLNPSICENL